MLLPASSEAACVTPDGALSLPALSPTAFQPYSFGQWARSAYHRFWYRLEERFAWSRGTYHEQPAGRLSHLSGIQQTRIASLQRRFRVRFEHQAEQTTALKQYDYLDVLERTWSALGLPYSVGGAVQDIGSSNFWYATAMHTFFQPSELVGIELEGYRIYTNGYSRLDYAQGYIEDLPNTHFVIRDYAQYHHQADVVTAWYPFVTPAPVLAWRMPLSVLAPHALFAQVARNLKPNGFFIMVNQGTDEAAIAAAYCRQSGLSPYQPYQWYALKTTLRPRISPVVSCWRLSNS